MDWYSTLAHKYQFHGVFYTDTIHRFLRTFIPDDEPRPENLITQNPAPISEEISVHKMYDLFHGWNN